MSEVVVITGASAGVGRAIACRFARHGASVALLARNRSGLEGAKRDVERLGGKALSLPTDVADQEQVEAAAQSVEEVFGPIDVWVNNAMTSVFAEFVQIEPEEFVRATEVTYLGTVWGTRAALKRMLPRDSGSIVLVGSALAYRGIPLQAPYCGAKHAIKGFFESVRCELHYNDSNVRLTMVQLPAMNTPQFEHCLARTPAHPQPVPPIFQPEVAADAVYWAAHNDRRELYIGFSTVKTIVGNKLAPWFAEWYLARNGYRAQQLPDTALDPDRPVNLWEPLEEDEGPHGRFDDRSKAVSMQTKLLMHRRLVGLAVAAAGTTLAGLAVLRR